MHVEARTELVPNEILTRIGARTRTRATEPLRCALERTPPKVFLPVQPAALAPAAELRIDPLPSGSHVVLRLMWGPLPAPFPRALAALGLAIGLALLALAPPSPGLQIAAAVLAVLPATALWRQRAGERQLQDRLSALLGGCVWSPRPH